MATKIKKAVITLYSIVVILSGVALYLVVEQKPTSFVEEYQKQDQPDPEVLAVLSTMDQNGKPVMVPVKKLESLIPLTPRPAWQQHAVSWPKSQFPQIAIVIDDLGLSYRASERLAGMVGPYTLAYLPYADRLPEQTQLVRRAGHELMVHLPMQPKHAGADPGTNALLAGLPVQEFERRLSWNLSRFEGFVGVNNHMGSLLTEQAGDMVRIMMHLKRDGFLFLDSLTSPDSVGLRAAKATGVATIARDIFLDNIRRREEVDKQLAKVEKVAHMRGYAIAIGHPYEVTLDALADWQATLNEKQLVLVPISQLVHRITQPVQQTDEAR